MGRVREWKKRIIASGLSTNAKATALVLAERMTKAGVTLRPVSVADLSAETSLSTSAQRRAIAELGEASVLMWAVGGGRGHKSTYKLVLSDTVSVPQRATHHVKRAEQTTLVDVPAPSPATDLRETFESFWAIYPRREGKGAARTKFFQKAKKFGAEPILEGARRFAADPNLPTEKQFIPHPATWLHQERWDDDPLPERNGSRPRDRAVEIASGQWRQEAARIETSRPELRGGLE